MCVLWVAEIKYVCMYRFCDAISTYAFKLEGIYLISFAHHYGTSWREASLLRT